MPENTSEQASITTGDQASQATTEQQAAAAAATTTGAQDVSQLPDWAQKLLKETRSEAAAHRTENKTLKEYREKAESEKLTETERMAKAATDAHAERDRIAGELRQERAVNAIAQAAAKLGINPELASRLVQVEFDDNGKPKDVDTAVAALVQQYPNLVGGDATSATNGARSRAGSGTFTTTQIRDPKFYNENRSEILKAQREGRIVEG